MRAEGSAVPETLLLSNLFVAGEEFIDGANAVSRVPNGYSWTPAEANPIRYSIQLGEGYGTPGYFSTAVLDGAIVSTVHEFLAVSHWEGADGFDSLPKTHRFTFDTPEGWTAVAPGTKVDAATYDLYPKRNQTQRPFDLVVFGDVSIRRRDAGGADLRFVELPSTDGPDTN